jgi:DNA ligase-1
MRAQVHCGAGAGDAGRVAVYSRNKEEITESFPDLREAFASVQSDTGGLILDGEILGWDHASGQALPFAVLGQRIGRKRVPADVLRAVPAVFMAFDVLFAGGELQLDRPLSARRNLLESLVEELGALPTPPTPAAERAPAAQGDLFAVAAPEEAPLPRLMLAPSRLVGSAEEIDLAYAAARARANEGVMLKSASWTWSSPGRSSDMAAAPVS